jgi:hypothetical protein
MGVTGVAGGAFGLQTSSSDKVLPLWWTCSSRLAQRQGLHSRRVWQAVCADGQGLALCAHGASKAAGKTSDLIAEALSKWPKKVFPIL